MSIIGWVILGALSGWLASIVTGRNAQMGCIANVVVGIIGALVGGFLMSFFGASPVTGFNLYSLIVAFVGAVIFLAIWNVIAGRRAM